jgi:hypothetical protein
MPQPGYQSGSEPMWWWKVAMHLDEAQLALSNAMAHNLDDQRPVFALQDCLREGQAILLDIFRAKGLLPAQSNGAPKAGAPYVPNVAPPATPSEMTGPAVPDEVATFAGGPPPFAAGPPFAGGPPGAPPPPPWLPQFPQGQGFPSMQVPPPPPPWMPQAQVVPQQPQEAAPVVEVVPPAPIAVETVAAAIVTEAVAAEVVTEVPAESAPPIGPPPLETSAPVVPEAKA